MLTFDPALDKQWLARFKQHEGSSPESYILANPGDIIVAEQLYCYPKACKKFPGWHKDGLTYTRLAFEQSSGETTAKFKADLVAPDTIWDLTGGLGIDSYAFSQQARQVHYCEIAEQPFVLAKNNHVIWGATNIKHHQISAEDAVSKLNESDWVFIDPSRRRSTGRAFLLKDCDPNVLDLLPQLRNKSVKVLLKLSPLYDLHRLQKEIPDLTNIFVVSVDGEVKEILVEISGEQNGYVHAVCLPEKIELRRALTDIKTTFSAISTSQPNSYIHVPDAAIIKAETIDQLLDTYPVTYWGNSIYLTSEEKKIPGCRSYEVIDTAEYKPKKLKRFLNGKKVNIHKRNFPIETTQLYKILGVSMGDDYHLFFTTNSNGGRMVCITHPA